MQTILDNTERDQKVLVVCKKDMIEREYIPNWPRDDERFKSPKAFTSEYGWELAERFYQRGNFSGTDVRGNQPLI